MWSPEGSIREEGFFPMPWSEKSIDEERALYFIVFLLCLLAGIRFINPTILRPDLFFFPWSRDVEKEFFSVVLIWVSCFEFDTFEGAK